VPFDEREQESFIFLSELYVRSEGDSRQGVPYEELVDALGLGERVTKRLQRELQEEGLVELTAVPPMTRVGWSVLDSAHRRRARQIIGITLHGVQCVEGIWAKLNLGPPHPCISPDHSPRNSSGCATATPDMSL
jgi:hypothetical protein